MDDAVFVPGVVERGGDGLADQQAVDLLEVLLACEQGAEVVAVDVLHDEVPERTGVAELVALDDADVVDRLHCLFLGLELLEVLDVAGQVGLEDLDGDDRVAGEVHGLPDAGHAALADLVHESDVLKLKVDGTFYHRP